MRLHRVVVSWTGPAVRGAAVNVLHFDGSNQTAPPIPAILSTYQAAISAMCPAGTVVTVPGTGDTIEDTTGTLTGSWSTSGGGQVNGAAVNFAAAGAGGCVTWLTAGIVNGRKLKGRTFLVPFHTQMYEGDGTLTPQGYGALSTFGTSLIAAGAFAVWHRPTTPGGSDGTSAPVTGSRARDKVAFLRSRRD